MDKNNGGPAFPVPMEDRHCGMDLRDYFAIRAPEPSKDRMDMGRRSDHNRNPYNEPHKPALRSDMEIRCALAYEYADAMLRAREQ
ncbi:hypothetical protein PBR31_00059 [Xanthomonas phage PBR31]|uniref:Uncharacterized protein n=1 Tax=Xanthomonas phage PPDBI TaxID=2723911 RepID=A0A6H0X5Z7_9CAUD|nr:hypothetical protein [Ralstonia pickettii]NYS09353.1 hypothetical protein [Ralstonia pickettii]QIN95370.1 hypothetical protein PBR31_00059 [Xanthomonas phage PBR31]QIW89418.1 hypothetical protein PPDBI_00059 [Xanthomonas phage PPDBI]